MSLEEQILDLAREHLPAATAGVLKERLETLETVEAELTELKESYKKLELRHNHVMNEKNVLERYKREIDETRALREELHEKERELSHKEDILNLTESMTNNRLEDLKGIVATVFKNREVVHQFSMNGNIPLGKDQYGVDQSGFTNLNGSVDTEEK